MKYFVYSNLNHDGKEYTRGNVIEITDLAAPALIEMGVIGHEAIPEDAPAPVVEEAEQVVEEAVAGGAVAQSGEPSADGPVEEVSVAETPEVQPRGVRKPKGEAAQDISADL
jgi:hypothetical protein